MSLSLKRSKIGEKKSSTKKSQQLTTITIQTGGNGSYDPCGEIKTDTYCFYQDGEYDDDKFYTTGSEQTCQDRTYVNNNNMQVEGTKNIEICKSEFMNRQKLYNKLEAQKMERLKKNEAKNLKENNSLTPLQKKLLDHIYDNGVDKYWKVSSIIMNGHHVILNKNESTNNIRNVLKELLEDKDPNFFKEKNKYKSLEHLENEKDVFTFISIKDFRKIYGKYNNNTNKSMPNKSLLHTTHSSNNRLLEQNHAKERGTHEKYTFSNANAFQTGPVKELNCAGKHRTSPVCKARALAQGK